MQDSAATGEGDGSVAQFLARFAREAFCLIRRHYVYTVGVAILLVSVVLVAVGFVAFSQTQASVQADAENSLFTAADREAEAKDGSLEERQGDVL